VIAIPTDVSKPEEAERLIDQTVDRFGRIEVLINAAGLMLVGAEPTLTLDDFRTLMDVNFWGAVYTSRAALRHMRPARFGRIANVSSVGGRFAAPHMMPYTTSKLP
jgi:NAD(P)-dependent dehydrogenase (short-subunit alcohol dehydrogenase family)